jgi:hypothetical protein
MAEPNDRERELARQIDHELVLLSEDAGTLEEAQERSVALLAVKLAEYREELLTPGAFFELTVGPSEDGREVLLSVGDINLAALSAKQAQRFALAMLNDAHAAAAKGG